MLLTCIERIEEVSKRFYNLIPHQQRAGQSDPLIQSVDLLKEKLRLLESLTDIEVAYRLIRSGGALQANYAKLRTRLSPLDTNTLEYSRIADYVRNSHAKVHDSYSLSVEDVFAVERQGERERFMPFKQLHNHKLLVRRLLPGGGADLARPPQWHGSRLPNYIGILSQGLRIAPPEAPITGYFLGKGAHHMLSEQQLTQRQLHSGVYFADMVSKSADYCKATPEEPIGLLMLCDVALGRSFEVAHGKFITKTDLDKAKFQSTKGCGELAPDPDFDITTCVLVCLWRQLTPLAAKKA